MEYKIYNCESYKIHTIKTDKFKNCTMEIIFKNKIEKEHITENNMIVDLLMYSSQKYKRRRDVAIELENLYSSFIRGSITRLGESSIISFVLDFLNPKYCEDGYLKDVLSLPFEMILNPNIENGEFNHRSFNIVRNRIKSDIESLKENSTRYAIRRGLTLMDSESPISYHMIGNLEDLETITPSSLIEAYNNIINNYECDIYIIGNLDMDEVVNIIKKKFKLNTIKTTSSSLYAKTKVYKTPQDIEEHDKYEQDSLIMIYNLNKLNKRERNYVVHIYNFIFGNGSLTTKLYQYLREENSLCYQVASMYQKYDNLMIIFAGIDSKDKEKCIKLINKAINEMIKGDFTEEDIENAKKSIISSIRLNEDNPGGIINTYLFNEIDDLPFNEERIKEFKSVTKEEIMSCAKKMHLNTIYLLGGEKKQ